MAKNHAARIARWDNEKASPPKTATQLFMEELDCFKKYNIPYTLEWLPVQVSDLGGSHLVTCRMIFNGEEIKGTGSNSKSAKHAACKIALRKIG